MCVFYNYTIYAHKINVLCKILHILDEKDRKEERERWYVPFPTNITKYRKILGKKYQHSILTLDVQACYKEYIQCYSVSGLISTG